MFINRGLPSLQLYHLRFCCMVKLVLHAMPSFHNLSIMISINWVKLVETVDNQAIIICKSASLTLLNDTLARSDSSCFS